MSRIRIPTQDVLKVLRDQYRLATPTSEQDFIAAAKLAGCSKAMARRAWSRGWRGQGIEPLETELVRERTKQAQLSEVLRNERITRETKTEAVLLQQRIRRLQPRIDRLVDLAVAMNYEADEKLSAADALKQLRAIVKMERDIAAITVSAVELDRLVSGEPGAIVGVKQLDEKPMTEEEMRAEVEAAQRALDYARTEAAPEASDDADLSN